ncbi:unnamed protein product [Triticum turgidum subsp. durum]|uniref:Uncharacterized protein n=1 Tax=Triticum turgidum subsp. durum TaxID=4567 RepID=A0A9R1BZ94_TRITD|nr:unnamed protein product [Triticum turgidum subsp. durum]
MGLPAMLRSLPWLRAWRVALSQIEVEDGELLLHVLQTLFKTLAITFSRMMIFTGITSLYGSILQLGRPAGQPRVGLGHHLLLHLVNGCRHVGDFSLPVSTHLPRTCQIQESTLSVIEIWCFVYPLLITFSLVWSVSVKMMPLIYIILAI